MLLYKLGKLEPRIDSRNIKFSTILNYGMLPALPVDGYDVDVGLGGVIVDTHMFNNSTYGDCVIAGRAHHTLRFEYFEQSQLINILDNEVVTEYFNETGGPDSGLVMLDSLNKWRQNGWLADGKRYDIYAFTSLNIKNHDEVKYCIYLLRGAYVGIALPKSAQTQVIWDVTSGPGSEPWSWGGHCVYIVAWNNTGPICVTWGKRQQMTWAFWDKYCDEAYGIVDNRNNWMDPTTDPVNVAILSQYLADITQGPLPPTPVYHTLSISVNGGGTTNPPVGTYSYVENSVVSVNAIPASGWQFVKWTGGVSKPKVASTTVIMGSNKSITANLRKMKRVNLDVTITTITVIMDSDKSISAEFEMIPPQPPQPSCCDLFKSKVGVIWQSLRGS